ncbi:hypothetical protein K458DRAFT_492010 [Lentithecium fluviatile CBS 122367]|uniref:Rhodopsin domain-containing protein n=1 Tax=Lentithecium fluviatile CBS 122367 TaxID=1168545 RepID=A0A6G1IGS3_9PLEO|nr:hypothetical protein K458DRAFT_492010 [Lentithecium fluviatile CBS 122367]
MAPAPQQMAGQMPDFTKTPLVPPPQGTTSNFIDPVSRTPMAMAVSAVMLALSFSSIVGRFYARKFVLNTVGWDDWTGLAGWIFSAEYTVYAMVLFSRPGMGPHMWDIPGIVFFDNKFGLRLLFTEVMYCPSAYLVKLSIFLLYKRIFVAPGGRAKKFIMGGLYGSSVLYFVLFILSFAFCTKSTSVVDGGECHTKGAYVTWALAAINLVTDIYLLAIPPFVISRLNITTQRKFAVSAIFLFGIAATITSIISVYYRVAVSRDSLDFSWNIVPAAVATICELNLGVVCSSLPAMNVLFHRRRHQQRTDGGYVSATRNGWSLNNLVSRVTNRVRPNSTIKADTNFSQHNTVGERDIVKLIDITQYSVAIEPKNTSMDGSSNPSPAPSSHGARV